MACDSDFSFLWPPCGRASSSSALPSESIIHSYAKKIGKNIMKTVHFCASLEEKSCRYFCSFLGEFGSEKTNTKQENSLYDSLYFLQKFLQILCSSLDEEVMDALYIFFLLSNKKNALFPSSFCGIRALSDGNRTEGMWDQANLGYKIF